MKGWIFITHIHTKIDDTSNDMNFINKVVFKGCELPLWPSPYIVKHSWKIWRGCLKRYRNLHKTYIRSRFIYQNNTLKHPDQFMRYTKGAIILIRVYCLIFRSEAAGLSLVQVEDSSSVMFRIFEQGSLQNIPETFRSHGTPGQAHPPPGQTLPLRWVSIFLYIIWVKSIKEIF